LENNIMTKCGLVVMAVGLIALAGCGGSGGSTGGNTGGAGGNGGLSTPISNSATVDFGTSEQTIEGFGGADAWMPAMPAGEVASLFGTGANDIGLTILRGRIDPTSNWTSELTNAKAAIAASSDVKIIATPWTPPASMKSNSSVVMGSLLSGSYLAYANYLESFVQYMASGGVNLYAISMQNEPDANVSYESCVWTPQQMDTWVAQNVNGVLTTKLIMPESESFTTSYADTALNDPNAVGKIDIIAGHLYGTSPSFNTAAENAGKEVWMTEHYLQPPNGAQPGISDALQAAEEIHNSLTVGDYNAYVWWWVADWDPGTGVTNYGLVNTSNNPTYYGWAMAQFSRFVRPGYVRSDVTSSATNVFISAYKGNGHFVIVAINGNSAPVNQTVAIQSQSITSMTPYQTTSSSTVAQQSAVSVTGNQFSYTLPAQSIVTFVE